MERLSTAGFHHVALVAGDVSRSLALYRDALGLRPLEQGGDEGDEEAGVVGLACGGPEGRPRTVFSLRPGAGRGRPGIGGLHHTALGVAEEEGLLRWKRRLVDLGWPVSGPYDRGYFTSIYFRDPDGQVLEIATAGPGYAIDEPADALGGELMLPPQRIVRGHRDEAAIAALTHPEPVPEITPDMALSGIHHVSGITDSLERAGEFYGSVLGLSLVKRTTNRDDPKQLHYFWANLEDGRVVPHTSFTLFGWPPHWNQARDGVGQTLRVAFRARGGDQLDAWADHLRAHGVQASLAQSRSLRFRAPDGMRLEIVG